MQKGFSLVELLVVVAIIAVIMGITVPLMQSAMLRAHVGTMAADARVLNNSFKQYYIDFDMYPNATAAPALDLATLEPLVSMGYSSRHILDRVDGGEFDAYDSPDELGINQEFWIELTLAFDPTVRFLVADSDNAPLSGGDFKDGVYLYRDGVLLPLSSPIQ
jgi:prepilin-type N-terminal cleavage/methylation domain-containing protein